MATTHDHAFPRELKSPGARRRALLFYAWGGWAFVFWGVCARVTAGVAGHWLIGHFAHNHGGMSYEVRGAAVQGRNVRWT